METNSKFKHNSVSWCINRKILTKEECEIINEWFNKHTFRYGVAKFKSNKGYIHYLSYNGRDYVSDKVESKYYGVECHTPILFDLVTFDYFEEFILKYHPI